MKDLAEVIRFRGFQKLALKYAAFGVNEMISSIFVGYRLKELKKYIPEVSEEDITR